MGGTYDDWKAYFEQYMPPNHVDLRRGNAARLITFTTIEGTNIVFDMAKLGWHLPDEIEAYLRDRRRIHFVWSQTDALMVFDAIAETMETSTDRLIGQ